MQRTLVAGLLIVTMAGCGGGSGGGSTPQGTFDAMKAASAKHDWNGMVSCMSAETQDLMLGSMTMMVQFMGMMPGGGDKLKGASEILAKHGVKLDAPPKMDLGADPSKADPTAAMKQLTAGVKDKPACLAELMEWMEKNGDKSHKAEFDQMADATLSDVKIDGDKATGKVTAKVDGKDQTHDAHFKKIDGKWYVDLSAEMGPGAGGPAGLK
jgi:hypothetical protein